MDNKYLDYNGLKTLVDAIKNGTVITGATKGDGIQWGTKQIPLANIPQTAIERLYTVKGMRDALTNLLSEKLQIGDLIKFNLTVANTTGDTIGEYENGTMFVCKQNVDGYRSQFVSTSGYYASFNTAESVTFQRETTTYKAYDPIYVKSGETIVLGGTNGYYLIEITGNYIQSGSTGDVVGSTKHTKYTVDHNCYIIILKGNEDAELTSVSIGNSADDISSLTDSQIISLFNKSFEQFVAGISARASIADSAEDVVEGSPLDEKLTDIQKKSTKIFDYSVDSISMSPNGGAPSGTPDIVYVKNLDQFLACYDSQYHLTWSKYGLTQSDYNATGHSVQNTIFTSSQGYVYNSEYYPTNQSITTAEINALFI